MSSRAGARPQVVAVGECGLDYFRNYSPRAAQQAAFHRQLELAQRTRQAASSCTSAMRMPTSSRFCASMPPPGAAWPTASPVRRSELRSYLALGLAIGITGWICDERRGTHLAALMPHIPRRAAAARDRRPVSAAAGPAAQARFAAQRTGVSSAHRRRGRARARGVAAQRSRARAPAPRGRCLGCPDVDADVELTCDYIA